MAMRRRAAGGGRRLGDEGTPELFNGCSVRHLWEMDVDLVDGDGQLSTGANSPYAEWGWAVFCWDGIMPAVIVIVPLVARLLFPRNDAVSVVINVFLPIFAFFIRLAVGNQRFARGELYGWQSLLFLIAVFFLIFLDTMLILFQSQRGGIRPPDWTLLGLLYLGYLTAMAVAFFPLRYTLHGRADRVELEEGV